MKQKYLILGVIVAMLLISGCAKQQSDKTTEITREIMMAPQDSGIAEFTIVYLTKTERCPGRVAAEAAEGCPTDTDPNDYGSVRIDKILNYSRDPEAEFEPIKEGIVAEMRFLYSARPAKIKYEPGKFAPLGYDRFSEGGFPGPKVPEGNFPEGSGSAEAGTAETETSASALSATVNNTTPLSKDEAGRYIYVVPASGEVTEAYETLLQGLKEGDRIRAQFTFTNGALLVIGEYEIIS